MESKSKLRFDKPKSFCAKYPFYTFEDVEYSKFMTKIMNSLEIRFYEKNDIICKEMDEALEILFVEQGFYEVGFEINNCQFYETQFSISTIIGGFQICYQMRHSFIYKAQTQLRCLAIRRQNFMHIINNYPQFKRQIEQRMFAHFS